VAKQIWLGPVLGNNRASLLARCAEYIANGKTDRLLYIAASHPLLDLVTERLLDGKNAQGVWGEFPVYLFRGLVRRVLSEAIVSEPGAVATGSTKSVESSAKPLHDPVATAPGSDAAGLMPRTPIDREEFPLRRSLISQIIKQLSSAGRLQAIRPLANRDGCVNTIASLIGELQRAGKTPEEFRQVVAAREIESQAPSLQSPVSSLKSQLDFDREVALIYSAYADALEKHGLTDEDADQLRALQILRGGDVTQVVDLRLLDREPDQSQINNLRFSIPFLDQIDLLVLDGFFDFTPVQGEILKYLIPLIPNVIVNLNGDSHNPDIFRPFQSTIDHLTSIDEFEIQTSNDAINVAGSLSPLRARLFNVDARDSSPTPGESADNRQDAGAPQAGMPALHSPALHSPELQLFECADRELEIRSIAKEIKRLVLKCNYKLSDIALVVRERAAYADTIARVLADEAVPCNLERRVEAPDVPAVRACGKLFQLLKEERESKNPKVSDLAHLIKTDYFRLSREKLDELNEAFEQKYASQFLDNSDDKLRRALAIGQWNGDNLENAIAYVGSELRVNAWVDRALKLIKAFPSPEAAQSLLAGGEESEDAATIAEDELPPEDGAAMDRRKKPAPIHPAALAWAVLIVRCLQQLLSEMPEEDTPEGLRNALMLLLDRLQFSSRINHAFRSDAGVNDAPQATLDVRGRESLRRAIAVAVRSFSYAQEIVSEARPSGRASSEIAPLLTRGLLTHFIDEVERSLRSQVLAIGAANRDGLRVLEATDVRGLRFRAIFIAGMIEGGFPLRTSRDWLYPHEERVRLQKHGIFLEDISTDTLLKEEHYFYQSACRATERLYLTRPLALNDGSEPVASYYIEALKRAIAPAELLVKQIRGDVDGRRLVEASTATELATILIRQGERQNRDTGEKILPLPLVKEFLARAEDRGMVSSSALRRVEIEHERNSKWFGPYDGEITNADLRKMLARHFSSDHVYSASRFSTYGNCAFRFFANRVLKLEPRSEAALDLQAIDAGKLLHDILRRFFEKHRGEYLPLRDHNDLRDELSETADAVFREHEDKVPPLNDRIWKIDCEIRKLILDQVLLYELRLQEKTNARGVRPAYFELAFGRASQASDSNSTSKYLKLERAGETALVQGQIDRVDVNEKERVAVAYDYKLSLGAGLEDIKSGRQVQIPIYLAALEQLFLPGFQLGGGGYYTLRGKGPRLNKGLYRLAFADCTNVTWAKGMLDDVEWRRIRDDVAKRVWEFIDGMRGGHFSVKPSLGRLTCKFCDYSAVCRYDAYRISRKN
jgi:ATP-dependent helicase/DNAse subunit B